MPCPRTTELLQHLVSMAGGTAICNHQRLVAKRHARGRGERSWRSSASATPAAPAPAKHEVGSSLSAALSGSAPWGTLMGPLRQTSLGFPTIVEPWPRSRRATRSFPHGHCPPGPTRRAISCFVLQHVERHSSSPSPSPQALHRLRSTTSASSVPPSLPRCSLPRLTAKPE